MGFSLYRAPTQASPQTGRSVGGSVITRMGNVQKRPIHRDIEWVHACQGRAGNGEGLFNRYRVSFWSDENVLEFEGGDCHTSLYVYANIYICIYNTAHYIY